MNQADTSARTGQADTCKVDKRERHPREKKIAIAREAIESGASLASVALRHGLNANMLRKWVVSYRGGEFGTTESAALLPVVVNEPSPAMRFKSAPKRPIAESRSIEVVLPLGVIRLSGPLDAATLSLLIAAMSAR